LLADSYFDELKTLKIVQGTNWITFMVLAVARYQQAASRHGSVVVIYTHVGELELDGEGIFFEESLQGAFQRAGLKVDGNGRRLSGVTEGNAHCVSPLFIPHASLRLYGPGIALARL
jgi:hypothetical protein